MTIFRGTCTTSILPKKAVYFKEEEISDILTIECDKPGIREIYSVSAQPEIGEVRVIKTEVGKSNEGQVLTGTKLVIELNIKEKITYIADEKMQSIYALSYENLKSSSVILPNKINGEDVRELLRAKRINVIPYIEAINIRKINSHTIFKCIVLFVDVKVC